MSDSTPARLTFSLVTLLACLAISPCALATTPEEQPSLTPDAPEATLEIEIEGEPQVDTAVKLSVDNGSQQVDQVEPASEPLTPGPDDHADAKSDAIARALAARRAELFATGDAEGHEPQEESEQPSPDEPGAEQDPPNVENVTAILPVDTNDSEGEPPVQGGVQAANETLAPASVQAAQAEGETPASAEQDASQPSAPASAIAPLLAAAAPLSAPKPAPNVCTATAAPDGTGVLVSVAGDLAQKAWNVAFEVVGPVGTQWVQAWPQTDGSWAAIIAYSSLVAGSYTANALLCIGEGTEAPGSAAFSVDPTGAELDLSYDKASNSLMLRATKVSRPGGVAAVSAGVSGPMGPELWVPLAPQADGSWLATLDPASFGMASGSYSIVTAIADAHYNVSSLPPVTKSVNYGANSCSGTVSADGSHVDFVAAGPLAKAAWNVAFVLDGPFGLQWVQGERTEDGTWATRVDCKWLLKGFYQLSYSAAVGSHPLQEAGHDTFEVGGATCKATLSADSENLAFTIAVNSVVCPSSVKAVSVGIVNPSGAELWYPLGRQADGSWRGNASYLDLGWESGTYRLQVVAADNSWAPVSLGSFAHDLAIPSPGGSLAAKTLDDETFRVTASGPLSVHAWNVAFEVTGAAGTTWHQAKRNEDGSWSATLPRDVSGGGMLTISGYASVQSISTYLASTTHSGLAATPYVTCWPDPSRDLVFLSVAGGATRKATNVAFAVHNNNEGTASWFQATKQADGSWAVEAPMDGVGVGSCTVVAYGHVGSTDSELARDSFVYYVDPMVGEVSLDGSYDVSYGMSGLKTQLINQALGLGWSTYPRYLEGTVNAVRHFQATNGLPVTGVVDYYTWRALGLSDFDWKNADAYVSPTEVAPNASTAQRMAAMVSRAYDYLGTPYVWDAAGAPGQGVDCAGLVMQCLYAAGVDTGIINPVTHASTSWGDHDARNLYYFGGFNQVGLSGLAGGDLIYYAFSGIVDHVALYVGSGTVIDALPGPGVAYSPLNRPGIVGATRFID